MGPVLVSTMVQPDTDGPSAKKLHPFFTRAPEAPSDDSSPKPPASLVQELQEDASAPESDGGSGRKKRRNGGPGEAEDTPVAKKPRRKRASGRTSLNGSITKHLTLPVNQEPLPDADNQQADIIPTPPQSDILANTNVQLSGNDPNVNSKPDQTQPAEEAIPPKSPKNKKVLLFNRKTGTLGSPPKPKRAAPPSLIVKIKYGNDEGHRKEIGSKIGQILEGPHEPPKATKKTRSERKSASGKSEIPEDETTSKEAHPFFTGKKKPQTNDACPSEEPMKSPPRRQTISMVTPKSPRKQRHPFEPTKIPNFGGTNPVGIKVPGAMHPAWPSQGMAHVRDDDALELRAPQATVQVEQSRKYKGQVVSVTPEDSVLRHLVEQLDLQSVRRNLPRDDANFSPPPPELRLPTRRFESGRKLQERIRPQLRTLGRVHEPGQGGSDFDELSGKPAPPPTHPAISRLFKDLESNLSAYDRSTCENLAWTQRYAPTMASQIIQAGKEAFYLKQWLGTLKVQAVDTGNAEGGSRGKSKGEKVTKKRRKNKLDGFVVDSTDEEFELDEVSDEEADWAPAGPEANQKTVIRHGSRENRGLPNAVVISGPHGSGKTAAAYAVAKELGFEVFEINSSSRRSGKDLLEKVGDMTRNHLVQQHRAEATAAEEEVEDEVAKDLKSGKQGMMTAFFKPKAGTAPKTSKKKKAGKAKEEPKATSKLQKQSLILVEEVDVLYEEDKQFWATLMGMIAQSKRPFIMTCNDETLVPIQSLTLYGILRFSPPPVELAADICLLIAANEGHALERHAVEDLYLSRGNDLRAVITELNYWCQIGVGDCRGGFDWFYLRWPKGIDLDENGDVVRVISENTYMKGMGWIARDPIATCNDPWGAEEEAVHQCWDSWHLNVCDWHSSLDMAACTDDLSKGGRVADLSAYQDFCQALSDCDLYSNGMFGANLQEVINPCVPELSTKTREDYVVGRQLLEADPLTPSAGLEGEISTSVSSLARNDLLNHASQTHESNAASTLTPIGEQKAITILESSFKSPPSTPLTRRAFSLAFDPIAASDTEPRTSHLILSIFDGPFPTIVLDIAPWVRSIVSYDHHLMLERKRLGSLLSEGGVGGKRKRMRNTRAAYSALEGGERRSTRRERYFGDLVNMNLVLGTGVEAWREAVLEAMEVAAPVGSMATVEDE